MKITRGLPLVLFLCATVAGAAEPAAPPELIAISKAADIVAVPGNVLSDIHATEHPVFVMRAGRIVVQTPAG